MCADHAVLPEDAVAAAAAAVAFYEVCVRRHLVNDAEWPRPPGVHSHRCVCRISRWLRAVLIGSRCTRPVLSRGSACAGVLGIRPCVPSWQWNQWTQAAMAPRAALIHDHWHWTMSIYGQNASVEITLQDEDVASKKALIELERNAVTGMKLEGKRTSWRHAWLKNSIIDSEPVELSNGPHSNLVSAFKMSFN